MAAGTKSNTAEEKKEVEARESPVTISVDPPESEAGLGSELDSDAGKGQSYMARSNPSGSTAEIYASMSANRKNSRLSPNAIPPRGTLSPPTQQQQQQQQYHRQQNVRGGRVRSNSRSAGSKYTNELDVSRDIADGFLQESPVTKMNNNNIIKNNTSPSGISASASNNNMDTVPNLKVNSNLSNIPPSSVTARNKYTHILILKSLNQTFETKFLMIPFKPEVLKLGRPVVNNNNNNNSNTSASTSNNKKNSSALVRPDNGNFDSRVLSRNHACITCDPQNSKIYIRDLKSSNGTFVNGNRVEQNEVELKIGDIIDLGTDIDTKFEHRKISAFVEEISVIPLINSFTDEKQLTTLNANGNNIKTDSIQPVTITPLSAQRAAFEAAMFGDVNNLELEDAILGSETEVLSGIFINNTISTSPNLINVIKTLATELSLERKEYLKLRSMENFLINYTTNLEFVNKLMIEMNDKQLIKLQNTLKQTFNDKHEILMRDTKQQIEKISQEKINLENEFKNNAVVNTDLIKNLQIELDDLKTRLQVEKYKNSQLSKNSTAEKAMNSTSNSNSTSYESSNGVMNNLKPNVRRKRGSSTPNDATDDNSERPSPIINNISSFSESDSVDTNIDVETEKKSSEENPSNWKRKRMLAVASTLAIGVIAYFVKVTTSS